MEKQSHLKEKRETKKESLNKESSKIQSSTNTKKTFYIWNPNLSEKPHGQGRLTGIIWDLCKGNPNQKEEIEACYSKTESKLIAFILETTEKENHKKA